MCISPPRKVPVQITTAEQDIVSPVSLMTVGSVSQFSPQDGDLPNRTPVTLPHRFSVLELQGGSWLKRRSNTIPVFTSKLG
jgi:hypothetical protein